MRVLTVVGTRPEAVKMAPVIQQLQQTENVQSRVCVTAQHREMLDQVLTLFEIQPDIDLNLMTPDQSLAELSAAIFAGLDPVFRDEKPDWLLIQGDTTTVMVAAILAYYNQIRIGHVEAGLRTWDKWQPFPEEINRKIAGVLADALLQVVERPYQPKEPPLSEIPDERKVILVTAHRRENFGEPFERIFGAIRDLASEYEDRLHIIYPVHLNPNVQEPARRMLADLTNVSLVEPLEYLPMAYWMKRATLILTDSGGLQEEAPALGTPVLVLRERTERPEALEAGTAKLVGSDPARAMAKAKNPFGDGHAAERIVHALINYPNSMAS
jgi:UDP-N-acetylglucosamine 2-epimerase (non-hydrolysing)